MENDSKPPAWGRKRSREEGNRLGEVNRPYERIRPREGKSALESAYESVRFRPMKDSGRPGTPHRFFKDSFELVHHNSNENGNDSDIKFMDIRQVVHKHANGLAIITAGATFPMDPEETIKEIRFEQQPAAVASESSGKKRKQQAQMLKGKQTKGIVDPRTVLAKVVLEKKRDNADCNSDNKSGSSSTQRVVDLYAGVWGSLLEVNPSMSPQLLTQDPLLDGYLAVILPTGPFPPRECLIVNQDDHNGSDDDNDNGANTKTACLVGGGFAQDKE